MKKLLATLLLGCAPFVYYYPYYYGWYYSYPIYIWY